MCHIYKLFFSECLLHKMGCLLILTVIILGFIWIQRQQTDIWNEVYYDFNEILRESSEMSDSAIQSILQILSHETNRKMRLFECTDMSFDMDNLNKSINEDETCEAKTWKDVEGLFTCNFEECLKMIETEELMEDVFEEMVKSGKEISSIKEQLPGIIEANCLGEEDDEECKLQLLLSVKSHVADLLEQASVSIKIMNEIVRVYWENARICFENI